MKRLLVVLIFVSSCTQVPKYHVGECLPPINVLVGKCKIVEVNPPYYTLRCEGWEKRLFQPEIKVVDSTLKSVTCPNQL